MIFGRLITYALGAALAAACLAWFWADRGRSNAQRVAGERLVEIERLRGEHATLVAEAQARATEVSERFRQQERSWNQSGAQAAARGQDEKARNDAVLRGLASERDGLRLALAEARAAADAQRRTSSDTATACFDSTSALRDLLEKSVHRARSGEARMAGAAEGHAAEVRELLDAWPRTIPAVTNAAGASAGGNKGVKTP